MNANREKILVRGVNWLGDAVMSTPALLRLREAKPNAEITLLTHEKLADLWRGHSAIDRVLTFKFGESAWNVGRKLRAEKLDLGLALPNSHRTALELFFAGIPARVGYARPFRNLFLTNAIPQREYAVKMRKRSVAEIQRLISGSEQAGQKPFSPNAHHIFQYLHLVAALGAKPEPLAPKLFVSENEVESFRARLQELSGTETSLWLGLNPGAEYGPAKRWLAENFIATAMELHQKINCGWMIFGTNDPATRPIANELERRLGKTFVANFVGNTTLRELFAGLKSCKLVLTNDTGPMHVAAALGTPVVVPVGSTSMELTGPGLPGSGNHTFLKGNAACAPCFLRECPIDFRCMKSIRIESVIDGCLKALESV
jgi:heptosyltransferase-2